MSRWAAVVAGGPGSRFWPLSTDRTPKQFLELAGPQPLLVQTIHRLSELIPTDRVLVVTSAALADRTRAALPQLPPENVLAEPRAASTGPALAWATATAARRDPDASLLSLHADWFVGDDAAFRDTAATALGVAERLDRLVTVGVEATRPEESYGYIVPGEALDPDAREVDRFVEKPSADNARALIADGALWNTGLFAWTAERFMAEARAGAPEIASALSHLEDDDPAGFFAAVTPIAVDVSHYERSARVALVAASFPWDDVGTWTALARVHTGDADGNVTGGDAHVVGAKDCVVWSDAGPVVVHGVSDLVVVHANGTVLVTTRDGATHLKDLLAALPSDVVAFPSNAQSPTVDS